MLLAFIGTLHAAPLLAQRAHLQQLSARFHAELATIARQTPGVLGVALVDLTSGARFGINDTLVFPQGSAIKIPILLELFRQAETRRLRLDERVPIRAADHVGGSGLLQYLTDGGSALSLHDLAVFMIVRSDNTATNILIDRLGMERVNHTLAGLAGARTRLQRKMVRPEESASGRENLSTPREAVNLMVRLVRCQVPVSAAACAEIRRILEIPKEGSFREAIPDSVAVAWKPGEIEGVGTAWAFVDLPGRPYAVAAMVNYSPDNPDIALRAVSTTAYRYFSQLARATPHGARVPLEYFRQRASKNP